MREVNSTTEAAELLRAASAKVVAVDGAQGSGKSRLAGDLGKLLGMSVVHLDDFVQRGQGAYVAHLDLEVVANAVSSDEACIVEGICVLQVLERIEVSPNAFVYVKRMGKGYWLDEDDLASDEPLEEHLARLREEIAPIAARIGESGELGLSEEVIRYHAAYRPHERATVVFLRNDS